MAKKPPQKKTPAKKTAKKASKKKAPKKKAEDQNLLLTEISRLRNRNAVLESENATLIRVLDRVTGGPDLVAGAAFEAALTTVASSACTIKSEEQMLAVVLDALRKDYPNPNLGKNSSLKATGDDSKTIELRYFPIDKAIQNRGCRLDSFAPSDMPKLDIIGKIASACWEDIKNS